MNISAKRPKQAFGRVFGRDNRKEYDHLLYGILVNPKCTFELRFAGPLDGALATAKCSKTVRVHGPNVSSTTVAATLDRVRRVPGVKWKLIEAIR